MNKWNFISEEKEVDSIIEASNHKTQIIFKHSVSCGISQHAKSRLDTDLLALAEKADLHYLDLLKFRNVSNYIAQQLEVLHQSPQIIVLKDKKVIQVLTHSAIQTDKILPNLV